MQQQRARACALSVRPDISMPITKQDGVKIKDRLSQQVLYQRRIEIDRRREELALQREMREWV